MSIAKSDKKSLQRAKKLKRDIQRGFGKLVCKELHFACANCKAQALIGHLNWYVDLLEWPQDQNKQSTQLHKQKTGRRK